MPLRAHYADLRSPICAVSSFFLMREIKKYRQELIEF